MNLFLAGIFGLFYFFDILRNFGGLGIFEKCMIWSSDAVVIRNNSTQFGPNICIYWL